MLTPTQPTESRQIGLIVDFRLVVLNILLQIIHIYICMYACMYVCMHVCIRMYVYIYVCVYVCMYVCMYWLYGIYYMDSYISLYIYVYMCLFLCEAMCVQWRPNKPQTQNPKPNALIKPQAISRAIEVPIAIEAIDA